MNGPIRKLFERWGLVEPEHIRTTKFEKADRVVEEGMKAAREAREARRRQGLAVQVELHRRNR